MHLRKAANEVREATQSKFSYELKRADLKIDLTDRLGHTGNHRNCLNVSLKIGNTSFDGWVLKGQWIGPMDYRGTDLKIEHNPKAAMQASLGLKACQIEAEYENLTVYLDEGNFNRLKTHCDPSWASKYPAEATIHRPNRQEYLGPLGDLATDLFNHSGAPGIAELLENNGRGLTAEKLNEAHDALWGFRNRLIETVRLLWGAGRYRPEDVDGTTGMQIDDRVKRIMGDDPYRRRIIRPLPYLLKDPSADPKGDLGFTDNDFLEYASLLFDASSIKLLAEILRDADSLELEDEQREGLKSELQGDVRSLLSQLINLAEQFKIAPNTLNNAIWNLLDSIDVTLFGESIHPIDETILRGRSGLGSPVQLAILDLDRTAQDFPDNAVEVRPNPAALANFPSGENRKNVGALKRFRQIAALTSGFGKRVFDQAKDWISPVSQLASDAYFVLQNFSERIGREHEEAKGRGISVQQWRTLMHMAKDMGASMATNKGIPFDGEEKWIDAQFIFENGKVIFRGGMLKLSKVITRLPSNLEAGEMSVAFGSRPKLLHGSLRVGKLYLNHPSRRLRLRAERLLAEGRIREIL